MWHQLVVLAGEVLAQSVICHALAISLEQHTQQLLGQTGHASGGRCGLISRAPSAGRVRNRKRNSVGGTECRERERVRSASQHSGSLSSLLRDFSCGYMKKKKKKKNKEEEEEA